MMCGWNCQRGGSPKGFSSAGPRKVLQDRPRELHCSTARPPQPQPATSIRHTSPLGQSEMQTIFVQIPKFICLLFDRPPQPQPLASTLPWGLSEMYLSKMQTIFVQIAKYICLLFGHPPQPQTLASTRHTLPRGPSEMYLSKMQTNICTNCKIYLSTVGPPPTTPTTGLNLKSFTLSLKGNLKFKYKYSIAKMLTKSQFC